MTADNQSSLRDLIREIVREEIQKLRSPEVSTPVVSVAEIVRDEIRQAFSAGDAGQEQRPVSYADAVQRPLAVTPIPPYRQPPRATPWPSPQEAVRHPPIEPMPSYHQPPSTALRSPPQEEAWRRPQNRRSDTWRTVDRRPLCYQRLMADEQRPPETPRRRVGFQFPWSAFVHYPQRTDPQDLPQTPPPDSPPDSTAGSLPGSPRVSPTRTPRTRRRRRRARKRFDAECLILSFLMLASVVILGTWLYISISRKVRDVHDPAPWAFWRLRKHDSGIPRILLWDGIKKSFSYDNESSETKMRWSSNITECPFEEARSGMVECEITDNRYRFEWSDAVVFEANRLSTYDLPHIWPRFPMWVLWAQIHLSPDSEFTHNSYPYDVRTRFNWTMGRREDADIVVPYKSWRCGVRGDAMVAETAERNRKALGRSLRSGQVAWISGTCEKEAYQQIREMAKHSGDGQSGILGVRHVDIGMFDQCGRGTCATPLECVRQIAAHYNFIVVRLQPDCFHSPYELIYEAFEYDLVPVGVGAAQYDAERSASFCGELGEYSTAWPASCILSCHNRSPVRIPALLCMEEALFSDSQSRRLVSALPRSL
ncbi:hypothetical protein HPB50_025693 [Hyalomma asiaticum]|uniref:Uncharacterized protein n=1 Tax=Hyalomma asiaticum TaxID=266040 RepID=A0ACB7SHE1_HYAAI|nr:hypothetical protein HPB50_025693 [Hyalomma asiaticum]